jgi:hypothetical protein
MIAIIIVVALAVIGASLITGGVFVLFGTGFALICWGAFALAASAFISRGIR